MCLYGSYEVYLSLSEAPGSSHICLSSENPDFGSQKCNNLGLKSAIRYKARHVIQKMSRVVTYFFKKSPQLSVHDISWLHYLLGILPPGILTFIFSRASLAAFRVK